MIGSNELTIQRRAKRRAVFCTVLYMVLVLPVFWWFAFFSAMLSDSPNITVLLGILLTVLYLSVPGSMPMATYFIWSSYRRRSYRRVSFFCILPVFVALMVLLLHSAIFVVFLK